MIRQHHHTEYADKPAPSELHSTEALMPLVYADLRRLAASQCCCESGDNSLTGTILTHEIYLRVRNESETPKWEGLSHLFSAAAETMRRILVENRRAKRCLKRAGASNRIDKTISGFAAQEENDRLLAINEALDALEEQDPEVADLVKMRFFGGFTIEEIAQSTGVSTRTIARRWKYAKAWLAERLAEEFKGETKVCS